jgi:hypothetical protein
MEIKNFDPVVIASLIKLEVAGSVIFKDIEAAKAHLIQSMFKCMDGGDFFYCVFKDGDIVVLKPEAVSALFKIMGKELHKFMQEYPCIYTITCDIKAPVVDFTKKLINKSGTFMHKNYKPFEEYDDETKKAVYRYLDYMREVLCSGKQDQYNYLKKWTANMCKGGKNKTLLYLKSVQGVGKSHFPEFLRDYVLGVKISDELDTEALETKFNAIMCGKLLIWFEEVSLVEPKQWARISDKLKAYSTSTMLRFEEKGYPAFTALNISNIMVLSNHPCIKEADGRRIVIIDVSVNWQEDKIYFGDLREKCFNERVGEAFFSYMQTVDTSDIDTMPLPDSDGKRDAYAERLRPEYKFLKEQYIFNKIGLDKIKLGDLHNQYNDWAEHSKQRQQTKIAFCEALKEIKITQKKTNGYLYYCVPYGELLAIAKKKHWIHELDEFEEGENEQVEKVEDECETLKKIIEEQNKKIAELERKLALAEQKTKYEIVRENIISKHEKIVKELDDLINAGLPKRPSKGKLKKHYSNSEEEIKPQNKIRKFPDAPNIYMKTEGKREKVGKAEKVDAIYDLDDALESDDNDIFQYSDESDSDEEIDSDTDTSLVISF